MDRQRTLLATLPALLAGPACATDDHDSFRITAIEFDELSTITLTFSEPVAELDAIDPNDFRLSLGQTNAYGMNLEYELTTYQDIGGWAETEYYDYSFEFESIERSGQNQLVLTTADVIGPELCQYIDERIEAHAMYENAGPFEIGLFLHYAANGAGGSIPILANDGRELADFGRDWVIEGEHYTERESLGFIQHPIRIPCP